MTINYPVQVGGSAALAAHVAAENPHPQYLQDGEVTAQVASGTYIERGGSLAWVSGKTYRVGATAYKIAGEDYESAEGEVTLDTADESNPRLDVIALDTNEAIVIVKGTPASDPALPDVDPAQYCMVSFVLLPAGAEAPDVTQMAIYQEGGEWTTTASDADITVGSTNNPRTDTYCIEGTDVDVGDYFEAVRGSDFDPSSQNNLVFYIRKKAAWDTTRTISVQFRRSNKAVGNSVVVLNGSYGFNATSFGSYEQIVVPVSAFGISGGSAADRLRVTFTGSGDAVGFYIDDFVLQAGTVTVQSGGLTWRGTWSDATAYARNDLVFRTDGLYVALVANVNLDPLTYTTYWTGLTDGLIAKSAVEAVGDLIVGTGAGTVARKAIGSTGQILTVVDGTVDWATPEEVDLGVIEAHRSGMQLSIKDADEIYVSAGSIEINGGMFFAETQLNGSAGEFGYLDYKSNVASSLAPKGLCCNDSFVFHSTYEGMKSYTIGANGTLSIADTDNTYSGNYMQSVYCTDDFVFLCCDSGLVSFSFNESGILTFVDVDKQGSYKYYDVDYDGTFLYVATDSGLMTYTFDESGYLTHIDTEGSYSTQYVCYNSQFVFATIGTLGGDGIGSYTVDESGNLTFVDRDDQGGEYKDLCCDEDYVYATTGGYIRVHSFSVTGILTYLRQYNITTTHIEQSGNFIFAGAGGNGLYCLRKNEGTLVTVDTDDQGGDYSYLCIGGDYIYMLSSSPPSYTILTYQNIRGGGTLSADTTYHCYAASPDSGNDLSDSEITMVATAPTFVANKGAKYHSSDGSRRWLGSIQTDGAGEIAYIIQPREFVVKTDSDEVPNEGDALVYNATLDAWVPQPTLDKVKAHGTKPTAADVDAVAEAQTPAGAGNLTLTASPWTSATPRKITITSDGDDSGVTFTVTYKDENGDAQTSDAVTGPNAETVTVTKNAVEVWATEVSQIAISGAGTGNITVGISEGLVVLDLADGTYHSLTVAADATIEVDNWPADYIKELTIKLTDAGTYTLTWPAAVDWPGGTEPSWTASGVDFAKLWTDDGGTTVYGRRAAEDVK